MVCVIIFLFLLGVAIIGMSVCGIIDSINYFRDISISKKLLDKLDNLDDNSDA